MGHGAIIALGLLVSLFSGAARANINLELRPVNQSVTVGSTINLGLYAVSDSPSIQLLSAAQVIVSWNVSFVQLSGLNNAGGAGLLSSAFGSDPYGLNASLVDGNAMWVGLAPLGAGNSVPATPGGTLLTTLQFLSLAPTTPSGPGGATLIDILPAAGNPLGHTTVFDGITPNTDVTGELNGALVQIVPIPAPPTIASAALGAMLIHARRRPAIGTSF